MMKSSNSIKQALNQLLMTLVGGHRQRWANKRRMIQESEIKPERQQRS